ncbi:MAG: iron ABC transporter permease [Gemmatimonadaceae bacterium]|nr:iron ABC transporter permease [Gemmatimonadaceae bacterium]
MVRWHRDHLLLAGMLLVVVLASARWGAVPIAPEEMWHAVRRALDAAGAASPSATPTLNERIFLEIRLPRALLAALVGASLAVGGVLMQALFRNPIVEPGLIGTSSGAALGAALYFVMGAYWKWSAGIWTLPIAASLGAGACTWAVITLARAAGGGRGAVVSLLLTGIAVNALCASGVGFLSYIARDPQARSITFWTLGTLAGASWPVVCMVSAGLALGLWIGLRHAQSLNALMLGDEEARYLGVDVRRLRLMVLVGNVIMVAVATAFTGVIAFVGLVVPHVMRLWRGGDTRHLMGTSALGGAILLGLADLTARLAVAPAELPIGIVTSVVGVPAFLALLRRAHVHY